MEPDRGIVASVPRLAEEALIAAPKASCAAYATGVQSGHMFTFVESSSFERICAVYLDDDEYAELQQFMMQNPEAGQLVRGAGGVLEAFSE